MTTIKTTTAIDGKQNLYYILSRSFGILLTSVVTTRIYTFQLQIRVLAIGSHLETHVSAHFGRPMNGRIVLTATRIAMQLRSFAQTKVQHWRLRKKQKLGWILVRIALECHMVLRPQWMVANTG